MIIKQQIIIIKIIDNNKSHVTVAVSDRNILSKLKSDCINGALNHVIEILENVCIIA